MLIMVQRQLLDSLGRVVRLGTELGRGGEGTVFETTDRPELVAKVYKTVDHDRMAKLWAMVQLRSDRLVHLAAWPVDTVHERQGGPIAGFLMPRVSEHRDIHQLYGPKSRLLMFPEARWPFLIHAAANVARAFTVIHEHGHVIGDVNHGNLMVSTNATVKLIDCDSFQITANGRHYPCLVGVSTHTPPELQGKNFRSGVVRTRNHDAFGLAVVIFQLLFMGRYPFAGTYLGSGDMPIERAISEFRFAYGERAGARSMRQPPATLALRAVSEPVANLFERAFSPEGVRPEGRPSPEIWVATLDQLERALVSCSVNASHHFLRSLNACPWCRIEVSAGVHLFSVLSIATHFPNNTFRIESVWSEILAVPSPGPLPQFPQRSSFNLLPSDRIVAERRKYHRRHKQAYVVSFVLGVTVIALPLSGAATFWFIVFALIGGSVIYQSAPDQVQLETKTTLDQARSSLKHTVELLQNDAGDAAFHKKRAYLTERRTRYQQLLEKRQEKLKQLALKRDQQQRHRFLDAYAIERASIPGIGPGRVATLQSYGIETAADITEGATRSVPGIGPALTSGLLSWRRGLESRYRFNPRYGSDPAAIALLDQEFASMRAPLEQDLQNGAADLRHIRENSLARRKALWPTLDQVLREVAQAEIDLEVP